MALQLLNEEGLECRVSKKMKTSVEGNERLTSGKEVQENFHGKRFLVYGAVGIVAC